MKTQSLRGFGKKMASLMFAFVFVLLGACLLKTSGSEVYAAEYAELDSTTYDDYVVAKYTDAVTIQTYVGKKAPTLDGYLFAGWFTSPTCTAEEKIASYNQNITEYYAKFVPEDVLSIKVQVSNGDVNGDTTDVEKNMRFVSSVDTLNYRQIGFRMKYQDKSGTWNYKINTGEVVFERIVSASAGDEYKFSPKVVDTKSEYFMTATWKGEENTGITEDEFDINYCVKAYWVTFDGVRVYGPTRYVSVNDGLHSNIVNIPVENTEWNTETKLTTVSYVDSNGTEQTGATATVAYNDGQYAHLKINLGESVNRTKTLSSATKFTISDGTNSETPIYRNLYTTHVVENITTSIYSDDTWYQTYYQNNNAEKEFVIATSADLYGLASLANTDGNNFTDITIYAVCDISVNELGANETIEDWATTKPTYSWLAINGFAGTFDGQRHTISGIYSVAQSGKGVGLFTETNNVTIRSLSVTDSYFNSPTTNGTGVFVGLGSGTFQNLYSDAILSDSDTKGRVGGIIGTATGEISIINCWSNSEIKSEGPYAGGIIANVNSQKVSVNHCLNSGDLTYLGTTGSYFGGIVGKTASSSGDLEIVDCLNVGIVNGTSATTHMGGILGNAGTIDSNGNETVTILNSYCAVTYDENETSIGVSIPVGSDKRADTTEGESVKYNDVLDMNAFCNTELDFRDASNTDGYWMVREGKIPMLVSFLGEDDTTLDVTGRSKTEFTIVDNIGYISNLSQLIDFRNEMNAVTLTLDEDTIVKVTNDIVINEGDASAWADGTEEVPNAWEPIENFSATFDGQGHTISGLYARAAGTAGVGLFTKTNNATIKDLNVTESYINPSSNSGMGVIVGQGNGIFENIYVDVIIKDSDSTGRIGGIVGIADGDLTIKNCWNASNIESAAQYCGGMLGSITTTGFAITIEHCLNTGDLTYTGSSSTTNTYFGGMVGRANDTNGTTGNLLITDSLNVGIVDGTSTKYMGGLLGYASKQGTAENAMTVITNSYSTINYDENSEAQGVSVLVGAYASKTYTVTNNSVALDYDELLGINSYYYTELDLSSAANTDAYWAARENNTPMLVRFFGDTDVQANISDSNDEVFTLTNNKGFIANVSQLYSFATQMDAGNLTIDSDTVVALVNDLVVNEGWEASATEPARVWQPIRSYVGTFNGQGNTISGLYATKVSGTAGVGLFTESEGVTVKDLSITNSYIQAGDINGTGAIVGKGYGTFENIYVDVIFAEDAARGRIGGIVGQASGDVTVSNCWNTSKIESAGQYCGGILGTVSDTGFAVTIEHCLNTGDLTYTGSGNTYFGGMVGRANNSTGTTGKLQITDCLNVGIVKGTTKQTYMGGLLGCAAPKGTAQNETTVITNSYSAINYDENSEQQGVSVLVGAYASTTYTVTNDSKALDYNEMSGIKGYCNTTLDFRSTTNTTGYWTAMENTTPVLADFVSEEDTMIDVSGMSRTEFTLVDNVGMIWNAQQLISFSEQMQAGTLAVNSDTLVMLTDNIVVNDGDAADWKQGTELPEAWVPIVDYVGTFDGQGYTISGLYATNVSGISGVGLFTDTKGVRVQNLSITNSYFETGDANGIGAVVGKGYGIFKNIYVDMIFGEDGNRGRLGGIIGQATGDVTISNCCNASDMESAGQYCGGMLGTVSNTGFAIIIEHCLNTGSLTYTGSSSTTNTYFGGMVGRANNASGTTGKLQITDCLNVGSVDGTSQKYMGSLLGFASTQGEDSEGNAIATTVITNSYSAINYDSNGELQGVSVLIGAYSTRAEINTSEAVNYYNLLGDYACYNTELNFKTDSNTKGYWVARESQTPMLVSFVSESDTIINVSEISKQFELVDNVGTIANVRQLYSFAEQVNDGTLTTNSDTVITLTANIDVNNGNASDWADGNNLPTQLWTPIKGFSGTFDGAGYTISGLYINGATDMSGRGLFTETNGATIKDLSVTDSYIQVDTSTGTGSIVGRGSGTFRNIYADVIIADTADSAKGYMGGIIGVATGDVSVDNCWSDCDITNNLNYMGGIIANCNGNVVSITHCYNTGNLTITSDSTKDAGYAGGIVGKTGNGSGTTESPYTGSVVVEDCLSVGIVKSESTATSSAIGGVIGNASGEVKETDAETGDVISTTPTVTIINSYSGIIYDDTDNVVGVSQAIGTDMGASLTNCEVIDYDSMLGELGYYYMDLDYTTTDNTDGYWYVRENDVPVLAYFVDESVAKTSDFSVSKTVITDIIAAYAGGTDIPTYATTSTKITKTDCIGDSGYEVCVQSTTKTEFDTYVASLENSGFVQYSNKTISAGTDVTDNNQFYTYVGKDVNVYLSWNPNLSTARVVMTPMEELPSLRVSQVVASDTVTPSITQMQLDGVGMMYVVQLANGEFIIIDGGTNVDTDKVRLYEFLQDNVPNGQVPVIACWMFTHPDPDHIGLASAFIKDNNPSVDDETRIDIKSFAYNFAGETLVTTNNSKDSSSDTDASIQAAITTLETRMASYYPHARRYNIHAGQSYFFKGLEVEILQTEEEIYPNEVTCWNDTSASWRMKFDNGDVALIVGDSMSVLNQQLADTYGDYLKSDIFQLAHHGLIGGVLEMYKYVDPDICFWATTVDNFNNKTYRAYEYNAYLLDTSEKTRIFYNNGSTNTVLVQ